MNVPYTTGLPEAKSAAVPNRSAFGLREHLITVFRQKRMLLTIIGVATMVAGPGSFLMTNIYSAEVRLLIQNARTPFRYSRLPTSPRKMMWRPRCKSSPARFY